jgi:hypothetical protein
MRRLAELQQGNPRPLRSPDYPTRPLGVFGFPVPSKEHACALETQMFARFNEYGISLYGDVDYARLRASRREWVCGLHPHELWRIMLKTWGDYLNFHSMFDTEKDKEPELLGQ